MLYRLSYSRKMRRKFTKFYQKHEQTNAFLNHSIQIVNKTVEKPVFQLKLS